jgi:hypothetical protein
MRELPSIPSGTPWLDPYAVGIVGQPLPWHLDKLEHCCLKIRFRGCEDLQPYLLDLYSFREDFPVMKSILLYPVHLLTLIAMSIYQLHYVVVYCIVQLLYRIAITVKIFSQEKD